MKRPTPKQLAEAADIAKRFARAEQLTDEEKTHVLHAADLMGMYALARGAK